MAGSIELGRLSRRGFLVAGAAGMGLLVTRGVHAEAVEEITDLKPGDYTWHPERSPDGPVAVVVSLPEQLVFVYRNGIRIAVSTCSTGKPGHETPTGVFTVLQKDKNHHSSIYDDASMPNTDRLTWSGVALHAGGLPGYPSSHGCVHLPLAFSSLLFGITPVGTPVIIAGQHDEPVDVVHPGLVLSDYAVQEADAAEAKADPAALNAEDAKPAVSIIVSGADKAIEVLENGETVASGPATIQFPDKPLGSYVYVLSRTDGSNGDLTWHAIGYNRGSDQEQEAEATLFRIHGDPTVIKAIQARMNPGAIMVTTDLPLEPNARSGKDFVVMDTRTES
ncbi:L,D-transpeptidase [Kaistia dalseonensis]|uniref:L,D-TPase catalytic domain-containing protein n=1 Tax=Kaistia dalseonensis TaxID=410840 RepID=A0ABU0HBC9_9HYPH|nr:L,D-transpeptidase [Kaistia dalseonensis]MCX5496988.1 L,D-transpeptidase [Kaistia dalseonensis]MDQ0439614.1 hypothetical protein [Kaistia dalseonensis]